MECEVKLLAGKQDVFGSGPLDEFMNEILSIKGKLEELVEKHVRSYAGQDASTNYQHDGILGEGAFAPVVVVGKAGVYGKKEMALKMIKLLEKSACKAKQDKAVKRAVLEVEALNLLRGQKGVFTIMGLALWEGNLVLALDLAEGGMLERWRGQLNEMELCYVTSQLMEAQQAMERAGIIHCDIKPANILLKLKEGAGQEGGKRKITDYIPIFCDFEYLQILKDGQTCVPEGEERGGNEFFVAPEVQFLKDGKSQAFDFASD